MKTAILLPGLGCDQRLFAHQIQTLKDHFNIQVIVCGAFDNMHDHIHHVLNNSPEKFVLIGHSFGGWIAQWIAIHSPARVSKLILIGTGTGTLTSTLRNIFTEMLHFFENNKASEFLDKIRPAAVYEKKSTDSKLMSTIKDMQDEFPHDGLINQAKTDLEGMDTTTKLTNIKCPTLLIHGKHDSFYEKDMLVLKENIPNNKYVEIDQCGHMLPLERPQAISTLIKDWLDCHTK